MSQPATVSCPHCSASNTSGSAWCVQCGKALPTAGGPRLVEGGEVAASAGGRALQSTLLAEQTKKASGALLAVAIVQVIFAGILSAGVLDNGSLPTGVTVLLFGISALFFGLWFWSRKAPLPAAIVGLVAYVSLLFADAIADPATLTQGIVLKAIIIAVLASAVKAGVQHRKILQSGAGA